MKFGGFLWVPALLFGEFRVKKYPAPITKIQGYSFKTFNSYKEYKGYYYYYFSEHFRNCFMMFYIGMYLRLNFFVTLLVN